jgi:hypothetical protein
MGETESSAILTDIDRAQAGLRRLLRSAGRGGLTRRPAAGTWSVMENVRHLLFAEQAHLGRLLPLDRDVRALGRPLELPGQRRMSAVGGRAGEDIGDVLAAWSKLHRAVRTRCVEPDAELARALQTNWRHLNAHVKVIERLLRV